MSLPSKITKENFRLLDLSSEEESEDLHLEIAPSRKKKILRRDRGRPVTRGETGVGSPGSDLACAFRWAVRGTTLLWLIMLTWLAAALYDQVMAMRVDINKVSTSSNSVGDALQLCHTAAKELRANASELSARVTALEAAHRELVKKVEAASNELASVTEQLASAPKLVDTPRRLAELQRTLADFGSQIKGFEGTLELTHKQSSAAASGLEEARAAILRVEERANATAANVTARALLYQQLERQVGALNETLAAKVDALRLRVDEASKVAITSTTTTTPAPPPAPPAPAAPVVPPAPPAPALPSAGPPVASSNDITVPATRGPGSPPKPSVTQ